MRIINFGASTQQQRREIFFSPFRPPTMSSENVAGPSLCDFAFFFYFISFQGNVSMGLGPKKPFIGSVKRRNASKKERKKKNPILLPKMYLGSIEL